MTPNNNIIAAQIIKAKILFIRGRKVILDKDLAQLYQIETRKFNQSVKRNIKRFPSDFMFQLTWAEINNLKSQFVTSSWGGTRKLAYAFTEQGIAMLSSVLNSPRAIQVNIQIMRTFVKIREMLANNQELKEKIEAMEKLYDQQFKIVFEAIKKLLDPPTEKQKKKYGFLADKGEK